MSISLQPKPAVPSNDFATARTPPTHHSLFQQPVIASIRCCDPPPASLRFTHRPAGPPSPICSGEYPSNTQCPCTVHAQSMHSPCTVHAQSMHSPCTVHAQSMHSPCTVHAQSMHSPCTVHAQSMHSPCTVHAQSMHSPCTVHVGHGCIQSLPALAGEWTPRGQSRAVGPLFHSHPQNCNFSPSLPIDTTLINQSRSQQIWHWTGAALPGNQPALMDPPLAGGYLSGVHPRPSSCGRSFTRS